jgi:hypothetical protein
MGTATGWKFPILLRVFLTNQRHGEHTFPECPRASFNFHPIAHGTVLAQILWGVLRPGTRVLCTQYPARVANVCDIRSQWHPPSGVPCFFNYIIYIYSLTKTTQSFSQWHPAQWQPTTWYPSLICRFYNLLYIYIYIYIHGPKRHGHSANDIRPSDIHHWSAVFTIYYIYIYIHWLKRHECSSSDACQRAAVFF